MSMPLMCGAVPLELYRPGNLAFSSGVDLLTKNQCGTAYQNYLPIVQATQLYRFFMKILL